MLAIHDQFTHQMRNRLKTTSMGLGLVRLLQDAGLTEEARTTLYSLENGFQGVTANRPLVTRSPEPRQSAATLALDPARADVAHTSTDLESHLASSMRLPALVVDA